MLTQKQGCHEVFLMIQPSPALVNTAYLSLSVRAVDTLVWIHFHKYLYLQRNTRPQHPVNWLLFLPYVSFTGPPAAYGWLHKLGWKAGLRTNNKYCLLQKHGFPLLTSFSITRCWWGTCPRPRAWGPCCRLHFRDERGKFCDIQANLIAHFCSVPPWLIFLMLIWPQ